MLPKPLTLKAFDEVNLVEVNLVAGSCKFGGISTKKPSVNSKKLVTLIASY